MVYAVTGCVAGCRGCVHGGDVVPVFGTHSSTPSECVLQWVKKVILKGFPLEQSGDDRKGGLGTILRHLAQNNRE